MSSFTTIYNHVLPGEPGGDTTWFSRQNSFEQQEVIRQVKFKRQMWPELGNGRLSKHPDHTYPHILPDGHERDAFYPLIADRILKYFMDDEISLHTEALNLKSSQVACLNFLFPFKENLDLATRAFRNFLPGLREVTAIVFEYTGPEGATAWLGEPRSGRRGQNRTSIDAAIFWWDDEGRKRASLVEWKYTERNFGQCSAYHGAEKKERELCEGINVAEEPFPAASCLLTSGKRHRSRRYWEHMDAAGISLAAFSGVRGCPFQGPFYQLLRQFLLGYYLKMEGAVDDYEIVSFSFLGNKFLTQVPTHLQSLAKQSEAGIVDLWNRVLDGAQPLRHVLAEDWMLAIETTGGIDRMWREYIRSRYGV
jgi:hypothetical protein